MVLEKILAGAAVFGLLSGPIVIEAAPRIRQQSILEMALQDPNLGEKDKNLYRNINKVLSGSIKPKGKIFYCKQCTTKVNNEDVYFTIAADYLCGPRGGNGTLNLWFYLNEERGWYNEKGIECLTYYLMTETKPSMSKKTFEINVNTYAGTVNYIDVDKRLVELSYVFNKSKDMFYQLAKKIKIDKKDIEKVFYWWNIKKDLEKYHTEQHAVQFGNLQELDHIYLTELNYEGIGRFDLKSDWGKKIANTGGTLRAPKGVKIEISTGELPIIGFNVQGKLFDFSEGNVAIVKKTGKFSITDTLFVSQAATSTGVNVEKELLNETEGISDEEE